MTHKFQILVEKNKALLYNTGKKHMHFNAKEI